MKRVISLKDLSKITGVNISTLYRWLEFGFEELRIRLPAKEFIIINDLGKDRQRNTIFWSWVYSAALKRGKTIYEVDEELMKKSIGLEWNLDMNTK